MNPRSTTLDTSTLTITPPLQATVRMGKFSYSYKQLCIKQVLRNSPVRGVAHTKPFNEIFQVKKGSNNFKNGPAVTQLVV
jgi:hypothetical protein